MMGGDIRPQPFMLDAEEVHVWRIHLDADNVATCLSVEEAERAARFVFDRDRVRFTVAHSALRDILASYTHEAAASILIRTAENGKPYLADHPDIQFNLSHSGLWALVAVARGRAVGVDIEQIRDQRPTTEIAQRFFATAEVEELMATPEDQRAHAFFACWSRKEAYIKARGEGLRIPLDSFEVSLGEDAVLRKAADRERWSLCSLEAPEGYAAALVVEGGGWRVKQLDWPCHPET